MLSAGVVADANVLLSAVIGKAAARVFFEFEIPVHVTELNAREVREYLPKMRPCPLPGCCGSSRGPSEVDPRLGLVRGRHAIRHAA
jgi:hypothetical protein